MNKKRWENSKIQSLYVYLIYIYPLVLQGYECKVQELQELQDQRKASSYPIEHATLNINITIHVPIGIRRGTGTTASAETSVPPNLF